MQIMQLKLISYNIWHGKKWEKLLPWIKDQNADILCLQEVTSHEQNWGDNAPPDIFQALKQELNLKGVLGKAWMLDDKHQSYQGCAILSRFPISSSKTHFLSHQLSYGHEFDHDWTREPRVLVEAKLNINNSPLTVFTTHLSYHKRFADEAKKLREADNLLSILDNHQSDNFIFAGDLNTPPDSPIIQKIQDAYQDASPDAPTFARHRFEHEDFVVDDLTYQLDYCFLNGTIKPLKSNAPNLATSDHLPLVIQLVV